MAFDDTPQMRVAIPRNRAYQGIVWLTINEVAFQNFRIRDLHEKASAAWPMGPHDCLRVRYLQRSHMREGFRVVLQDRTASGNRVRVRFGIDRPAPRSALLALGDHLTEVGIDWLAFQTQEGTAVYHRHLQITPQPAAV